MLTEVTPVPALTKDNTPDYTFNSDEAGTITYAGSCSSSTTAAVAGDNAITFDVLADGTYSDCTIIVTDAAGNPSSPLAVSSFTVDATPPVTTASAGAYVFGSWTNNNVVVVLSCDDGSGSGCADDYPLYCIDATDTCEPSWIYGGAFLIDSEGTSYVRFFSEDNAGNVQATISKTIMIDKTKPSSSASSAAYDALDDIDVDFTASDATSGIDTVTLYYNKDGSGWTDSGLTQAGHGTIFSSTFLFAPSGDGIYEFYTMAIDNAVNVEDVPAAADTTTVYDTTPPSTTDDYSGSAKDGVWQREDQTVNLNPLDTLSDIASTFYCVDQAGTCDPAGIEGHIGKVVPVTQDGINYVRYCSTDNAGNREENKSVEVMIDRNAQVNNSVVVEDGNITTVSLGNITLEINASVNGTVGISVNESSSAANSSSVGIPALGRYFEITAPALAGNMSSVMIKLYYTDAEVAAAGIDEGTLRLYFYNTTSNAWEKYDTPNGGVDTANNYVWAITDHFSIWGAFGNTPPAPPAPVITGNTVGGGCIENQWTCSDWSACQPNGTQTRTCSYTIGTCGPGYKKPATTQACTYTLTTTPPAPTLTPTSTPTQTPAAATTPPSTPSGVTGMMTAGEAATYAGIIVVIIVIVAAAILWKRAKKP